MTGQPWARLVLYSVFHCLVKSVTSVVLIPKCCPLGEAILHGSPKPSCVPDDSDSISALKLYSHTSPPSPVDIPYNFTHKDLSCKGTNGRIVHNDDFWIYTDGTIERQGNVYDPKKLYCIEYFINSTATWPILCAAKHYDDPPERFFFLGIGFFISVPFALMTVIVYLWIKEFHSLHGRIVVFNMSSLIVASLAMGLVLTRTIGSYYYFTMTCGITGYAIQFFFMATFFWLNVMCFDIYWAFSGLRNLTGSVKERERKKLIVYSIYAWCTPLLILVITVAVDLSPSIPVTSFFKPRVGEDKCFFKEKGATWIYFYLPMALIILSNIILFGVTAYRIWSHRREAAVLKRGDSRKHDSTNDKESLFILEGHEEQHYLPWYSDPKTSTDKYLFTLYLKLFIVMGINWVMELLSSIAEGAPNYLWYIPDFTNTLQGLFIFLIFVWKKRVRRLVWAKILSCWGKKPISSNPRNTWSGSSRNTNSTNSTHTVNNSIKMNPATQASQTTLA
nr:probable G-protein coupled receptor Mth-like 10 [Halyomorpha halys]